MAYFCFQCSKEVQLSAGKPGRTETCPSCSADLHACLNCRHYDTSAYNDCREPQAERVLDKNRSNFCDYFSYVEGIRTGAKKDSSAALNKLDDLFKR